MCPYALNRLGPFHREEVMYATREDIRKAAGELITCGFLGNELDAELKEVLR